MVNTPACSRAWAEHFFNNEQHNSSGNATKCNMAACQPGLWDRVVLSSSMQSSTIQVGTDGKNTGLFFEHSCHAFTHKCADSLRA